MTEPDDGSSRYPARKALRARVASSTPIPDDADTALDGFRFTDEVLAEYEPGPAVPADATGTSGPAAETLVVGETATRSERRLWAVAFVLAVVGGLLGGMVGIWWALG